MKTATFIIASLLLLGTAYAQVTQDNLAAGPAKISEAAPAKGDLPKDKQLELRNAQVERLQARIALDAAKAAYDQAAQADGAAQSKMSALVTEACQGAGLKNEECQVCDGPGPGEGLPACKGLKPQELAVRKLIKKDEKAEAKKP
jgi:hypothetical protein